MKIIIIGSKGFIGQELCRYYRERGQEVWGADVVVDYVNTDSYFLIDSSNSDFTSVFQEQEFDLCVNCSGAASVPDSINNPIRDYLLNTVNVFRMLDAIRKYQPSCSFMNLSSAAVYGNPERLPIVESDATHPLSPYGIHKLQAEQICREFFEFHQLRTCSLRIFSVYGNEQRKQLFWDLFQKASKGDPFSLYGTGMESRDYIHVHDLVHAIDKIASHSDFKADVINVANGEEVLIKDAVATFFSNFEEPVQYTFSGDSRKGDPVNWKADVSTLKSYGYKISVDMSSGLEAYYNFNRK